MPDLPMGNPFIKEFIEREAVRQGVKVMARDIHQIVKAVNPVWEVDDRLPHLQDMILPVEPNNDAPIRIEQKVLKKDQLIPKDVVIVKDSLRNYLRKPYKELYGLEIEIEGKQLPNLNDKFWVSKIDGSLRGEALEYIFPKPKSLKEVEEALDVLTAVFKKNDTITDFSYRTSTHVHVNILDLTKQQISSFIYLSHLLETALIRYSGDTRVGNRFCLSLSDAEAKLTDIIAWMSYQGFNYPLDKGKIKYSAINLASIMEFGSIEFRSLRGTVDKETILPWLRVLGNIREYSLTNSMKDIYNKLKDIKALLKDVFKEDLALFMYPRIEDDIRYNTSLLIELPFMKVM